MKTHGKLNLLCLECGDEMYFNDIDTPYGYDCPDCGEFFHKNNYGNIESKKKKINYMCFAR